MILCSDPWNPPNIQAQIKSVGTLAGKLNFQADMIAASLGYASRHTSEFFTHHDAAMVLEAGQVIRPKIAEKLLEEIHEKNAG